MYAHVEINAPSCGRRSRLAHAVVQPKLLSVWSFWPLNFPRSFAVSFATLFSWTCPVVYRGAVAITCVCCEGSVGARNTVFASLFCTWKHLVSAAASCTVRMTSDDPHAIRQHLKAGVPSAIHIDTQMIVTPAGPIWYIGNSGENQAPPDAKTESNLSQADPMSNCAKNRVFKIGIGVTDTEQKLSDIMVSIFALRPPMRICQDFRCL